MTLHGIVSLQETLAEHRHRLLGVHQHIHLAGVLQQAADQIQILLDLGRTVLGETCGDPVPVDSHVEVQLQ